MDEWEECADEEGRTFFVNKISRESVWEIPSTVFSLTSVDVNARDVPPTDEDTKTLKRTYSFIMDPLIQSRLLHIRSVLVKDDTSTSMATNMTDEEWLHTFDPIAKREYFYERHHGYMTTQPPLEYCKTDPLITWLLVLQCVFRCSIARRVVALKKREKEAHLLAQSKVEDAKSNDIESRRLSSSHMRRFSLDKDTESQRETDERRGMLSQEKEQCSRADRFWGIDQSDREIRRQIAEERLMRETEELRRSLQEAARKREEMQRRSAEELERKRRNEDSAHESRERSAMQVQELLQCKTDTFWGVQKQENDEKCAQEQMVREDLESQRYMEEMLAAQLHARWAMEAARAHKDENQRRLQQENRYRKQYLKLFKRATSSEEVVHYRWPTQTVPDIEPQKKQSKSNNFQYMLDFVLDRKRHSEPKNIFHSASSSHTVGRKGKLQVTQPEPCYHLDEPQVKHHSIVRPPPSTNNPNVPASKNGLPFTVDNVNLVQQKLRKATSKSTKKFSLEPLTTSNNTPNMEIHDIETGFQAEEAILAKVFSLIDADHGGTLDMHEMLWALKKDSFVRTMAMESVVLKDVLKKQSVEVLFHEMDLDQKCSITWETFRNYCCRLYDTARKEKNSIDGKTEQSKEEILRQKNQEYAARKLILDQEEAIAKIVFSLVDTDRSGKIDQQEMMNALDKDDRVREFVSRSRCLRPLLENSAFGHAFIGMATDDVDGMSLDEFLAFCSEIASISILNQMTAP